MSKPDDQPMIRFGGEWIPACDAWKKMETATVVVEHIERFNDRFPDLSSHRTRDVVPLVRQRLKDVELRIPRAAESPDLSEVATRLLENLTPDDVLDTLADEYDKPMGIDQLVQMVGDKVYLRALLREARDFEMNRISPEQNAQLWNELGRPAPGGGLWSTRKVKELLASKD